MSGQETCRLRRSLPESGSKFETSPRGEAPATTRKDPDMTTTTSYGTWTNRVNTYSTGPDADVVNYISGGDSDWRERVQTSGALAAMQRDYRAAIEAALPPSVSLCGEEFIGPAYPEPGEFDGYPTNEHGDLDIRAMVEEIDLGEIVERHDPDLA